MEKINLGQKEIIHFVGIGGIGMSGLAQIMKNMGFKIQGSDQNKNKNTASCIKAGIKVYIGHSKKNVKSSTILVRSSAIKNNNSEIKFAREKKIPIYSRAEVLADVVSLTFGGPIFVTVASIFFLSEKVGIKRWSAVFLGFIGMLLIVQPAFIDLNYFYITPIVFCIFFACVAISVRSLSKTEPNYTIAFYFTFLCTLLGLGSIFFVEWKMPTLIDFIIFTIMGLCGSIANLLLTQSYRLAEASLVTPIKYLSLVFAILFGFLIWSEVPKILTLFGALLVIASSLIIFVRESQLKKQIVNPRA